MFIYHNIVYLIVTTINLDHLPFSIRVLLESAIRSCDGFHVKQADIEKILDWKVQQFNQVEVPFRYAFCLVNKPNCFINVLFFDDSPSRVLLQDLTGVPCVVDFAGILSFLANLI